MKSESRIQSEIMLAVSAAGHKIFRTNAGKVKAEDGRFIKLMPKGFPDTCGWRKSDGKFFCIEIKNEKGRLRKEQKEFAKFAETQPIIYGVARSADDALKIVEEQQ